MISYPYMGFEEGLPVIGLPFTERGVTAPAQAPVAPVTPTTGGVKSYWALLILAALGARALTKK